MALADIIKYEGDNNTFIWKHPKEDFNSHSQLIVHESQEAIFFANGQALDLFGPGRYSLETQNMPILSRFVNRLTGGNSPFHCEVYFVNKTIQMGLKWGTPEHIRFIEPTLGIPFEIGASGELNLAVSDSRKLLVKLVGTTNGIAWQEGGENFTKSLQNSFRPLISTAVKTHLSSSIKQNNIDILEIDENLESLSATLKKNILPGFEEYGLTIPEFYITNVMLPDPNTDKNFKEFRELHAMTLKTKVVEATAAVDTAKARAQRAAILEEEENKTAIARAEAERQKIAGYTQAEIMQAQGYNMKDVFQKEVQEAYAAGIGNMTITGGSVAGDMVGLGVGMAAAGHLAPHMGEMFKGYVPQEPTNKEAPKAEEKCPSCGAAVSANAKFCSECGSKIERLQENEIICPACGQKTTKGKFCQECGASLIRKCPKCDVEVPSTSKFCPECGEKL